MQDLCFSLLENPVHNRQPSMVVLFEASKVLQWAQREAARLSALTNTTSGLLPVHPMTWHQGCRKEVLLPLNRSQQTRLWDHQGNLGRIPWPNTHSVFVKEMRKAYFIWGGREYLYIHTSLSMVCMRIYRKYIYVHRLANFQSRRWQHVFI